MSVMLKPFHVKDPQNDMYLAMDPHLKIFTFKDPPEAKFESPKNTHIQRVAHIFNTFQK